MSSSLTSTFDNIGMHGAHLSPKNVSRKTIILTYPYIPAVHQYWSPAAPVLGDDTAMEGQHGGGIFRDTMVRPGGILELLHLQWHYSGALQLE